MKTSIVILLGFSLCITAYRFPNSLNNLPLKIIHDEAAKYPLVPCQYPEMDDFNADDSNTPLCSEDGLERDGSNCPSLNCTNNCLLPDLDSRGCLMSCSCKSSGLWGDIMLTEEDVAMLESNRAGLRSSMMRWNQYKGKNPLNGKKYYIVYFDIDSSITSNPTAVRAINDAQEEFFKKTCIYFVPKPASHNGPFIRFSRGVGCSSAVGRKYRGKHTISIGRNCESKGRVMHEMMHAMGFWHEQMRPDRDNYVEVKEENIQEGKKEQFRKMSNSAWDSFGSPYDVGSIMHYGGKFFTKNGKATLINKRTRQPVIEQRDGFSDQDIAQIRAMYQCDNM